MFKLKTVFVFTALVLVTVACRNSVSVTNEFPTPEPSPWSTPLPKIELKPDVELEKQIAKIAEEAKGKVGVAAVVLETGDSVMLNGDQHFPMQSVYKLPIAMAVMEQIKRGELDLDEKIGVTKEDMVRQGQRSPLRDANPNGGEFSIRELIGFSLMESDGTASDVLMRVAGGAEEIQSYLSLIGVQDMAVVNTEKEIGRDWKTQYENWATPTAAVDLLRWFHETDKHADDPMPPTPTPDGAGLNCNCLPPEHPYRDPSDFRAITRSLIASVPGAKRLKALLPAGTIVAHKTGTGGTQNGITGATNDIGIITMPNGKNIAIAVFVSDSPADEKTREAVIAKIAKACWDRWAKTT